MAVRLTCSDNPESFCPLRATFTVTMSSATWRSVFTFNKYSQITARALRKSLNETERAVAERRGMTVVRYQNWENGKGGVQILLNAEEQNTPKKSA